ncbi:hypothetical protein [Deinococcus multiflagellatus]|uniref:Uncharacterized protein n=1 Tax=Deinococcus multiflagellatus TaxID=1656887 RepID=A0ABW1ZP19_9DEIO|nr:hypothetical protein [Deinococcus multiflagellatus]MBZ9715609.1 hypothetical protein [Deinococcus multiflagellatus]
MSERPAASIAIHLTLSAELHLPPGICLDADAQGVFYRLPDGGVVRPQITMIREQPNRQDLTHADRCTGQIQLTPGPSQVFETVVATEVSAAVDAQRQGRRAARLAALLREMHPAAAALTFDLTPDEGSFWHHRLLDEAGAVLLALNSDEPQCAAMQTFFTDWPLEQLEQLTPMSSYFLLPLRHLDMLSGQPEPLFYKRVGV